LTELERKHDRAPVPKEWAYAPAPESRDVVTLDDRYGHYVGGTIARDGFFKQQPPQGPGMRCSVIDKFSYGEVKATRSTLTVTPKGIDGKPLTDCAALTLTLK